MSLPMNRLYLTAAFAVASLLASGHALAAPAASGQVVQLYSNLSNVPGGRYYLSNGWAEVGGDVTGVSDIFAMPFTPAATSILLRINLALTIQNGVNEAGIVIAEDNNGVPGAALGEVTATGMAKFQTCCGLLVANFYSSGVNPIILEAGKTYWVYPVLVSRTSVAWNFGGGAVIPVGYSTDDGAMWTNITQFRPGAFSVYGLETTQ